MIKYTSFLSLDEKKKKPKAVKALALSLAPATGICSASICFRHESGGPMLRTLFRFAMLAEWFLLARVKFKNPHRVGRNF